jgi:NADP-dependent 3-hydroxy acid dehydrogenase YdfG
MAATSGFQLVLTGRRGERLRALQSELGSAVLKILDFDVRDLVATQQALAALTDAEMPKCVGQQCGTSGGQGAHRSRIV